MSNSKDDNNLINQMQDPRDVIVHNIEITVNALGELYIDTDVIDLNQLIVILRAAYVSQVKRRQILYEKTDDDKFRC